MRLPAMPVSESSEEVLQASYSLMRQHAKMHLGPCCKQLTQTLAESGSSPPPPLAPPGAAECRAILSDGEASRFMAEERVAEDESKSPQVTGWDQRG